MTGSSGNMHFKYEDLFYFILYTIVSIEMKEMCVCLFVFKRQWATPQRSTNSSNLFLLQTGFQVCGWTYLTSF